MATMRPDRLSNLKLMQLELRLVDGGVVGTLVYHLEDVEVTQS